MKLSKKILESDVVILVLGARGYGKTTFLKNLKREVHGAYKIICIDTLDNYTEGVIINTRKDLLQYMVMNQDTNYNIIYRPEEMTNIGFDFLINQKDTIIIIDEVDIFCSSKYIDEDFSRVLRHGRNNNIKLALSTRLPAEVHKQIFACTTDTILLHNKESNAQVYLSKFLDKNLVKSLIKLDKFDAIRVEHDNKDNLTLIKIKINNNFELEKTAQTPEVVEPDAIDVLKKDENHGAENPT